MELTQNQIEKLNEAVKVIATKEELHGLKAPEMKKKMGYHGYTFNGCLISFDNKGLSVSIKESDDIKDVITKFYTYGEIAKLIKPAKVPTTTAAKEEPVEVEEKAVIIIKPDSQMVEVSEEEPLKAQSEADLQYQNMLKKALTLNYENCEIKIDRAWIYISGETKEHKDELKEMGFWWAIKKKCWFFNHKGTYEEKKQYTKVITIK